MRAAANPAGASRLQSLLPVRRVAERESLGVVVTTMKIEVKTIRLAAVAFVCGFLFCAVLVVITGRSSPPVVAGGLRMASSQVSVPLVICLPDQHSPGMIHHDDLQT